MILGLATTCSTAGNNREPWHLIISWEISKECSTKAPSGIGEIWFAEEKLGILFRWLSVDGKSTASLPLYRQQIQSCLDNKRVGIAWSPLAKYGRSWCRKRSMIGQRMATILLTFCSRLAHIQVKPLGQDASYWTLFTWLRI